MLGMPVSELIHTSPMWLHYSAARKHRVLPLCHGVCTAVSAQQHNTSMRLERGYRMWYDS